MMNTPDAHDPHKHEQHASHEGAYLAVFLGLGLLTGTELLMTYTPEAIRYPFLVILMIAKAILVVTFFMHLRWEKRFYPVIVIFPTIIAALVALAVQQLVR